MTGNRAKYFLSQLPMCIPVIIFFIISLVLGILVGLLGLPEVVISLLSFVLSIVFYIAMAWPTAYIYMVQTVFYEKVAGITKGKVIVENNGIKEEGSEENN